MSLGYWETLAIGYDGTALTAAARASMLQGATGKLGLYTLMPNKWRPRDLVHVHASGRISCAVTTPGSITFDLSAGVGGTAFFSSGVIPLNIVVKNNVPWVLDIYGRLVVEGNAANMLWQGFWLSEAALNTAVPSTGPGPGGNTLPYNTAPVAGSNVDFSVQNIIDFNFTQTVGTGSCQCHTYELSLLTSTGY